MLTLQSDTISSSLNVSVPCLVQPDPNHRILWLSIILHAVHRSRGIFDRHDLYTDSGHILCYCNTGVAKSRHPAAKHTDTWMYKQINV